MENKCYYGQLRSMFDSKILPKRFKDKLCTTLIRSIISYESGLWILKKSVETRLTVFQMTGFINPALTQTQENGENATMRD